MTETILPPDADRTETHLISKCSAPQASPDGSVQLLTRRRGSRELFPSSWLRTPDEVRHAGSITEGTRLEFCSTELILQAKEGRTSIQKMAAGLRDLNNVPEVTWEDVASRGEKVIAELIKGGTEDSDAEASARRVRRRASSCSRWPRGGLTSGRGFRSGYKP